MKPSLSDDPADKLAAALSYPIGKWKRRADATYAAAPFYFDACWEWFERLSADDMETVLTIADVMGSAHKGAAESIAASLPPAPRCPL